MPGTLKPLPNFELRPDAHVIRVNLDSTKSKATGVTYIDELAEIEQTLKNILDGTGTYISELN